MNKLTETGYFLVPVVEHDSSDLDDFLCTDYSFIFAALGNRVHFKVNENFIHKRMISLGRAEEYRNGTVVPGCCGVTGIAAMERTVLHTA